jgi:TatD DNase family protein
MLTDTHAHLDFPELAADVEGVLARASDAGVTRVISIGTSLEGSRRAVRLAERFANVWATVGIHPGSVDATSAADLPGIKELARHPRVVAIGEIGLDHHWLPGATARREKTFTEDQAETLADEDETLHQLQVELFHRQMEIAETLGLNVVIHQRSAWDDTLAVLRSRPGKVQTVFHCFTESQARAEELLSLGSLVSFTGIVTFKNAAALQETAARIPAGKFMVETDSPYLAPVPHRGKPCQPAYTRHVAEHIAALRGQPLSDLAAETEATAERFFWRATH